VPAIQLFLSQDGVIANLTARVQHLEQRLQAVQEEFDAVSGRPQQAAPVPDQCCTGMLYYSCTAMPQCASDTLSKFNSRLHSQDRNLAHVLSCVHARVGGGERRGGVTSMCFQRSHSLLISQHLCSQGAHCAAEKHAQLMFERYQLASEHIRATEAEMAGLLDQLHAAKVRMQLYILCTATLVVANAPTSNSQLQCTDLHTNQLIAHWFKPACGMHNIWPRAQPQQSCGAQWALLVLDLPCAHKLLFLVLTDCCVYVLLQSGCSDAEMKACVATDRKDMT
jgi:hypothetical protein